jgi:Macrocin-O-methyltransferase (TylF)
MSTLFGFEVARAWDYENGFYLTSPVTRLAKALAHFELYKSIVRLPGHIVECGVYKGASLIRFATFREILESPYSRKLVGFDAFGKFPIHAVPDSHDHRFIERFERDGGHGIPADELRRVLDHKRVTHYELIEGDIVETVPTYVAQHPELKIALLHVDVDVYHPTVAILRHLWDRIVPGGLLVMDDYGTEAGETQAVDEFFAERSAVIEKLPISHIPSFIRK